LTPSPDLTARDKNRGEAAVQTLQQDAQLKQAKALKAHGGPAEIVFHTFDVTDPNSLKTLANYLKNTHESGIDFIINNAGIAMNGFGTSFIQSNPNKPKVMLTNLMKKKRCKYCQNNLEL
jgi:NAD(P)-dependent dehydrogenase (short-subunit alcohol dehydrogenase family)